MLCAWTVKPVGQPGSAFEEMGSTGLQFLWEKNDTFQSLNKLSFKYIYEMLPIADERLKDPTSFNVPTAPSLCLYYWSYCLVKSLIVCLSSYQTGIMWNVSEPISHPHPTLHLSGIQFLLPGFEAKETFFSATLEFRWDGEEFWSFFYIWPRNILSDHLHTTSSYLSIWWRTLRCKEPYSLSYDSKENDWTRNAFTYACVVRNKTLLFKALWFWDVGFGS